MVKLNGLLALLSCSSLVVSQTIKYMPFGDSITEIVCWRGLVWDMAQKAGYKNVDFVGSGKQQSNAGCKTPPADYKKDNEGHSGFLAIDIATKKQLVGWLQKNPADILTMHLATNDIVQQSKKTDDIVADFTTLLEQMRAANPHTKLLVSSIIPIGIGNFNTAYAALNKAIPEWAKAKNTTDSPIWFVDQNTGFPTADLRDGIHPNEAGDAIMAAKWWPALENAIKFAQANPSTLVTKSAKREEEFSA